MDSTDNQTVDLTWVEFSEEDTPKCEYFNNTCPMEATWIYTWEMACDCTSHDHYACEEHAAYTEKLLPGLIASEAVGCSTCGTRITGFTRRRLR